MATRVRLLVSRVTNEGAQNRGDEVDVPDSEVWPLRDAGQIEFIEGVRIPARLAEKPARKKARETATAKPAGIETTAG